MTDNTQQARAAVTREDNPVAAANRDHLDKFSDWKVGDPVE